MDYATTHHNRGGNPRRTTAGRPAQKTRGIHGLYATTQRHCRGTAGFAATCSGGATADGFLKAVFPATLKENKTLRDSTEKQQIAAGVAHSLSQLVTHYGIDLALPDDFCYPGGITYILHALQQTLKASVPLFESLRLVQSKRNAFFITTERVDTGQSLYYIPVVPLYGMQRDKRYAKAGALLLSVCSWLYRMAGVPYYRQEDAYLFYQFDMIKDWVEQDTDNEYAQTERQEIHTAAQIGDRMEKKLRHPANLEWFNRRLEGFKPKDGHDDACLEVATAAYALLLEYPGEHLFRNRPIPPEQDGDEYDENPNITMDKYISFSPDTKGWLFDTLSDTVNSEFNECGEVEEPGLAKCFDGQPVTGSLDFECRVFALMDTLCEILYNYKMQ